MPREMKDSGIEWIGDIPSHWKTSKIKYYVDCWDGKRVPVDAGERVSGPYPYWGAGNITDYVNDYLFDEELVLLGEDGAPFFDYTRPVAFLVNEKIWANNHIHVLKPHQNVCSSFLVHYLNHVDYKTYINGSILNKLTQSNMNKIAFVVPPLSEQQAIADFLDTKCAEIDTVIEQTKATIEEYKKLKQSVITEAVTKGIRGDRPIKDSGIEWIGDIPAEWDVIKLKYTSDFKQNKYSENDAELRYIGLENIVAWNGQYMETDSVYDKEQSLICDTNDVLFGKLRPYLAKVYISPEKQCCSGEFCVIAIKEQNTRYMWYQLISHGFIFMVDRSTYGTKMPRANADYIKNMSVSIPPLSEQEEIAEYLDRKCAEIDTLIEKKTTLLTEIESFKKSLIFDYVTGKKEVIS